MDAAVYYEVLRPASRDDLEAAGPAAAAVLKKMLPGGYVSAAELRGTAGARAAISWACSNGLLRRAGRMRGVLAFGTVRSWLSQISLPGTSRVGSCGGTRHTYATSLGAFNRWLRGREFRVAAGDGVRPASKSFSDVEDLLRFCEGSRGGAAVAKQAVQQYMAHSTAGGCSVSTALVRCAAIKSYFAVHEVSVDVRVGGGRRRQDGGSREEARMSLLDLYKMMTGGGMDAMTRAIVMVKFQAGLDSSTLADRFNFEAYGQIIRHFGAEDYDAWDLGKCPVPIKLVRVKTDMRHTTFIDRDAVSCLRDYLRWKRFRGGEHGRDEPLFVTRRGTPVSPVWVSRRFSRAAAHAGIQERISRRAFRVSSHETRDLLKSTLIVAGCAPYAADHVLGHYPRDSYEKQAILYPEAVRREYAKASGALNLLTGVERYLGEAAGGGNAAVERPSGGGGRGPDPHQEEILAQMGLVRADLRRAAGAVAGMARIMLMDRNGGQDLPGEMLRMITDLDGNTEEDG